MTNPKYDKELIQWFKSYKPQSIRYSYISLAGNNPKNIRSRNRVLLVSRIILANPSKFLFNPYEAYNYYTINYTAHHRKYGSFTSYRQYYQFHKRYLTILKYLLLLISNLDNEINTNNNQEV